MVGDELDYWYWFQPAGCSGRRSQRPGSAQGFPIAAPGSDRLAIELSYRHLDDDARQAFRFLPAVPGSAATGTDFGRGLELDPDLTQLTLYRLVDRSVAACEDQVDRRTPVFRLFELVRLYALERLAEEEAPEVVARFRRLLVTHLREEVHAGHEPDPVLRLDPTPLTAARDLAEQEE